MTRYLFSLALAFQALSLHAATSYQSPETDAYIQKYHKIAIRHMKQFHIPASITLAQGILESGSGRSTLAVKANNHFGIKCKDDYKGPTYYKSDDKLHECFRKYESAEASYEDHAHFIADRKPYASLFQYKETDYKKWAKGLQKCGYATNPKYPTILIDIIKANKLYLYDQNPDQYLKEDEQPSNNDNQPSKDDVKPVNDDARSGNNPPRMFNGTIAGVKCVVVNKGNTLYSLSRSAGVSVKDMYKYNDIDEKHVLQPGEILYVKSKNSKYRLSPVHTVEAGETLWSVSQKYAITLKALAKLNSLSTSAAVRPGQRLKLCK